MIYELSALVSIDRVIGLAELIKIDNKTSEHVSAKFEESWLSRYPTVCLGSTNNIFSYFQFYAWFGMLSKGMGKSFILSKDEPLTPNIDGVMAL